MDHDQSVQYLEGLLGRTLRIHTTDTRMFVGIFKCTDADRNIILANSFEYRMPTTSAVQAAAEEKQSWGEGSEAKSTTVKVNMTHRLIGLIVIPGRHITKMELDTKQHGTYGNHPRNMPQEKPGFCPALIITLVPAFRQDESWAWGCQEEACLQRALAAPSTWHRDHSSCIAVLQYLRWLDLPVCSQVIG